MKNLSKTMRIEHLVMTSESTPEWSQIVGIFLGGTTLEDLKKLFQKVDGPADDSLMHRLLAGGELEFNTPDGLIRFRLKDAHPEVVQ